MPTLRHLLAQATPPVALKPAWRAYLQALRADERAGGPRGVHRDRARVEQALDQEVGEDAAVTPLKAALRELLHGPDEQAGARAREVDALLAALAGAVAAGPVEVAVQGWPPGLSLAEQARLLGHPAAPLLRLPAGEVAALVAALDGRILGGHRLRLTPLLSPGQRLPAVPRDRRDRSPRDRQAWLPHLDPVGRWSASPRDMAERQAALLERWPVVIDAFCGCGGNAVALALAGRRVVAVEQDPGRAACARANARHFGVQLDLRVGDAAALLPGLAAADRALLLDPPWGGPGADRSVPLPWERLVPLPLDLLARYAAVLLKAPPHLDLATLPPGWRWQWRFELSPPAADGRSAVLAITALGMPARTLPATS